jgi:CspA family cold shock protein
MTSTVETSTETQLGRKIGQVKWFNNKAGYGFITVTGDDCPSNDIFIHYSSIRVANYKYLIQGEYVEFNLVKSNTDKHEYQANDVTGINSGPLMCETRGNYQKNDGDSSVPRKTSSPEYSRRPTDFARNRGSSSEPAAGGESKSFTTIRRRRQPTDKRTTTSTSTVPSPVPSPVISASL